jgi:dipeptidyl aminopeptidase/acylaminoacyl peptidase
VTTPEAVSLDGNSYIVKTEGDATPPIYSYVNLRTHHQETIVSLANGLGDYRAVAMTPIELRARDGLMLPCYVLRPNAMTPQSPVAVVISGGPFFGEKWGWRPFEQALVSRGYIVVVANYRGGSGFGAAFSAAGLGEAGKKMIDDVEDVLRTVGPIVGAPTSPLVAVGFSYGGYATAVAAHRQIPRLKAIALVNPLISPHDFFSDIPDREGAVVTREKKKWFGESPISPSLLEIASSELPPVWLAQASSDAKLPLEIAQKWSVRLRKNGVDATLMPIDTDHELSATEARVRVYRQMFRFLDEYSTAE